MGKFGWINTRMIKTMEMRASTKSISISILIDIVVPEIGGGRMAGEGGREFDCGIIA